MPETRARGILGVDVPGSCSVSGEEYGPVAVGLRGPDDPYDFSFYQVYGPRTRPLKNWSWFVRTGGLSRSPSKRRKGRLG